MWVRLFITQFLLLLHISSATEYHGEDAKTHRDATGPHSILQRQIFPAMVSFKPHKHPASHQPQPRSGCKDVHACPKAIKHRHNSHHKYKVTFPLARPSAANINDICHYHGQRRVHSYIQLPNTGFANLHRQIKAVHRMEMGYRNCCHMASNEHRLACSLEVWKRELHHFCETEKSIKTMQYHCCLKGNEKYDCFENDARHHSYTGDIRRGRNRHSLVGRIDAPMLTMSLPNVIFPPGEPNRENIHNICSLRKIRPRYPPRTLPLTGYHELTHRAKVIDQLEANYEECCIANNKLGCAHKQWKQMLHEYCANKLSDDHCCWKKEDELFTCFRNIAPFPKYDHEIKTVSLVNVTDDALLTLCQKHFKSLTRRPVSNLLMMIQSGCCPHNNPEQRIHCGMMKKRSFFSRLCGRHRGTRRNHLKCCSHDTESCFNSLYLSNITVAAMYNF